MLKFKNNVLANSTVKEKVAVAPGGCCCCCTCCCCCCVTTNTISGNGNTVNTSNTVPANKGAVATPKTGKH